MESLAVRILLLVATTLAAVRFHPPTNNNNSTLDASDNNSSCPIQNASLHRGTQNQTQNIDSLNTACEQTDAFVTSDHVTLPLMAPCFAMLITHMPSILLPSRAMVHDIKSATAKVFLIWISVVTISWIHRGQGGSLAYAMSLHVSLYLLSLPASSTVVVGMWADRLTRSIFTALVIMCAWQAGPPLPVLDAPGIHGWCGAASHLAGILIPDIVGPFALGFVHGLMETLE